MTITDETRQKIKQAKALRKVHFIKELEGEIEDINEKLRKLDLIIRRSPESKIFTRKGKIFASRRYRSEGFEVELRATDLMYIEIGLERDRDDIQKQIAKLLEELGEED